MQPTNEAPEVWVVFDEDYDPIYCANYPDACHEYVTDVTDECPEVGKWHVRKMVDAEKIKELIAAMRDALQPLAALYVNNAGGRDEESITAKLTRGDIRRAADLVFRADETQAPPPGKWILREVLFDDDGQPLAHREPQAEQPVAEQRAHLVMLPEEYMTMKINGWHWVNKDVDGFGNYGMRFHLPAAAPQPVAEKAEPVTQLEAVTKAIMFADCGNTQDWKDNIELGEAAIKAMRPFIRAESQKWRDDAIKTCIEIAQRYQADEWAIANMQQMIAAPQPVAEKVEPVGWKSFPPEPTDEIVEAIRGAFKNNGDYIGTFMIYKAYFAMLAAAPQPGEKE